MISRADPLDTIDPTAPPPIGDALPDPTAPPPIGDALPDLARLAVDAAGVARLLSCSERHVWGLHSSGRLPMPIKAGRAVRWSVDELREWLLAGAPPREKWQAKKEEARTAHGAR